MSRVDLLNFGAAVLALGLAVGAALDPTRGAPIDVGSTGGATLSRIKRERLPDGAEAIRDATGALVPLRPYRRIVSTMLLTDRLLVALCEPDRVIAFSAAGTRGSPWRHQYAGKLSVDGLGPLEPLIALKPDLVLLNSFGAMDRSERLRAAGMQVFDLGEQRGLSTMLVAAEAVGALVGDAERGRRFAETLRWRLANVSSPLGARPRRTAMYLWAFGGQIYGGTRGTSYHDVLTAAGLVDVAAAAHRDWPQYTAEEILRLSPELVMVKEGTAGAFCDTPGLAQLPACTAPGRIVEIPGALLDEAGPAMLDAAEMLFSRAYPSFLENAGTPSAP